ncbi:MAG TPA: LysM domain-containing protein [Steroidobacteraceae bacterium]|jgi:LysM repeat protein|nr:LysM domain-containing protein [Steroidobacteraceae bacterium]
MKTISSPTKYWRKLCLTVAASAIAVTAILPAGSEAQSEGGRTLATGSHIPLSSSAPDQYTVKQGDTLWGISQMYLTQPWYWPELWYLNSQIKNPHRIYPGDVLKLVNVEGQTRLTIGERGPAGTEAENGLANAGNGQVTARGNGVRVSPQVRSTPLPQAITTIPYNIIATFMGRPSIVPTEEVKSGPHIVGTRDNHLVGSAGDDLYVRGIADAEEGARFNVIHIDVPLKDPDNGRKLGYRGMYVGSGVVTKQGDPARFRLNESQMEALPGDRVFPEVYEVNADFVPHGPKEEIKAHIFHTSGVNIVGQYQMVAFNSGTDDGVDAGTVLAIYQRGEVVKDSFTDARSADHMNQPKGGKKVKLPNERIATVLVYKAYKHMSYALIMDSTNIVRVGDLIRNP